MSLFKNQAIGWWNWLIYASWGIFIELISKEVHSVYKPLCLNNFSSCFTLLPAICRLRDSQRARCLCCDQSVGRNWVIERESWVERAPGRWDRAGNWDRLRQSWGQEQECVRAWGSKDGRGQVRRWVGPDPKDLEFNPFPKKTHTKLKRFFSSPKKQRLCVGKPARERGQVWDSPKKAQVCNLKKRITVMGRGGWTRIPSHRHPPLAPWLFPSQDLSWCLVIVSWSLSH